MKSIVAHKHLSTSLTIRANRLLLVAFTLAFAFAFAPVLPRMAYAAPQDNMLTTGGINAQTTGETDTGSNPNSLAGYSAGDITPCTAQLNIKGKENYAYAYQVLAKVNNERAKQGLGALTMDVDLMNAAMQRAAETSLVFSHMRPNGEMCFTVCESKMFGENIAAGQKTPAAVMKSWMNSPGHRANILQEGYQSIGIGCFIVDGHHYWVQAFGYDTAAAAPQPANKNATHAVVYNDSIGKLKFKMKVSAVKKGKKTTAKIVCTSSFFPVTIQPSSFTFTSSKPKVATVNAKGAIKGKKKGKAKITATVNCGTLKLSKTVKVK